MVASPLLFRELEVMLSNNHALVTDALAIPGAPIAAPVPNTLLSRTP